VPRHSPAYIPFRKQLLYFLTDSKARGKSFGRAAARHPVRRSTFTTVRSCKDRLRVSSRKNPSQSGFPIPDAGQKKFNSRLVVPTCR
jgi:hypothetical protein